jgi:hypothetical protein
MDSLKLLNRAGVNFGMTMPCDIKPDHLLAISDTLGIVVCAIDNGGFTTSFSEEWPIFSPN